MGSAPGVWDPAGYLRFAGERGRPFADLVARVGAPDPRRVVDLGCGDGSATALLARRWPAAQVTGVDPQRRCWPRPSSTPRPAG